MRAVTDRLQELFPGRVVSLGQDPEWPARSPDMTPCNFFLWGYLKERIYRVPPVSLQDLEDNIVHEINHLRDRDLVRDAVRDMISRAHRCINLNGAQVEGRMGRL